MDRRGFIKGLLMGPAAMALPSNRLKIDREPLISDRMRNAHPRIDDVVFIDCLAHGSIEVIEELLNAGYDLNKPRICLHKDFEYPLFAAIDFERVDVVSLLIRRGADVNARGYYFNATPLIEATYLGYLPIMKKLLECGADPYMTDSIGRSVIFYAVHEAGDREHRAENLSFLLDRGIRPTANDLEEPHHARYVKWMMRRMEIAKISNQRLGGYNELNLTDT